MCQVKEKMRKTKTSPTGKTDRAERTPSGAAVLRSQITEAVLEATYLELGDVGFARLSMESIARRAGVGKPALYRRWKSKRELVAEALKELITQNTPDIDTGSLEEDILKYLEQTYIVLTDSVSGSILSDIIAELDRFPELVAEWGPNAVDTRHKAAAAILERAKVRGEISSSIDISIAVDFFVSPLYWRLKVTRKPLDDKYLQTVAHWIYAMLQNVPDQDG